MLSLTALARELSAPVALCVPSKRGRRTLTLVGWPDGHIRRARGSLADLDAEADRLGYRTVYRVDIETGVLEGFCSCGP